MQSLNTLLKGIVTTDICDDVAVFSIANDSRDVKQGALFLAYPGFKVDGRHYIEQAINQGAVAVCYEADGFELSKALPAPCIPVKSLKQFEALIAARFYDYPSNKLPVVGVTGTNGKTSVTHFIAQILGDSCGVIGTTGYGFLPQLKSAANTTPDAVRLQGMIATCLSQGAKTLAMEVSSHGLVEKRMAQTQFHTAVFTNLSREHLDYHKTMENYREAKAQIFKQSGVQYAVINADDPVSDFMIQSVPKGITIFTFSTQKNSQADIVASHFLPSEKGFSAFVKTPWGSGQINVALVGVFNLQNVLAAIGALGSLGVSFDYILKKVNQLHPVPGRMMIYRHEQFATAVVDYAHTPDALANALSALRQHTSGQLWCVFGCGGDRDAGKRAQMGAKAESLSDQVIITNDNPRTESPAAIADDIMCGIKNQNKCKIILDRKKAIAYAIDQANKEDVVLIAGKGHETTQTIGERVLAFSDSESVSEIFKTLQEI